MCLYFFYIYIFFYFFILFYCSIFHSTLQCPQSMSDTCVKCHWCCPPCQAMAHSALPAGKRSIESKVSECYHSPSRLKLKLQIFIFLLKRQLPCRAFLKGKQFPSLLQSITSICITCLSRNSPPTSAVWPNRPTARKTLVGSNCWAHHDIIIIKIIIVINTTRKKHFFKLLRSLNLPQLQRSSSS